MRFSTFIQENLDAIVSEWEAFAKTMTPAADDMSALALRNHSREILLAIVKDMQTSQSVGERHGKSLRMKVLSGTPETAATAHGAIRQIEGFDLLQMFGEFRALRATVLRLWRGAAQVSTVASDAVEEIERFNEGIDQAMAESVERYAEDVRLSRELFLGMVGHDLRSPLWVIDSSTQLLRLPHASEEARLKALERIGRSSKVMNRLLADLLMYSRTQLAGDVPLNRHFCDLGKLCRDAVDSIQGSCPDQAFELDLSGDLRLIGDELRLEQVLVNLLHNAVQHGQRARPIHLGALGEPDRITLTVRNSGSIPDDSQAMIFEPLARVTDLHAARDRWQTSLGLGLFIVKEIVRAHGGSIKVDSSAEASTIFTVGLPRAPD